MSEAGIEPEEATGARRCFGSQGDPGFNLPKSHPLDSPMNPFLANEDIKGLPCPNNEAQLMRLFVHDYAGHPFQVQLSRELARRGHAVVHAYAGGLLTPRGTLQRCERDPRDFKAVEVRM